MPYDIDTEASETKSGKPVKRVRFSDEVQNVYEFAGSDEISRGISMENESNRTFENSSVGLENSEFFAKETMKDQENSDLKTVNDDTLKSLSENVDEIPSYNAEEVNETADSISDDIISQNCENSVDDAKESIPFASNCVTNDLDELITDTMHLTISPPASASPPNHILSTGEPSLFSLSSETSSEKKTEAVVLNSELKNGVTSVSRKRSLEGMLIEKQTSKLNICLRKNNSEINSADELKNAVYNAWYKVKNEKVPAPSSQLIPEAKKIIDSSPKTTSHDAFETWRKSKRKAKRNYRTKKPSHKSSESVSAKTKEEMEESKMAFRAWKKKKDELLRHQLAEKYRKEEKERLDALMNERIRKNDAESAYSAWNAHKSVVIKMEKKKNQWLLEKEKEKLEIKLKKNEEAEKIYYDWLRNKVYSTKTSTYRMIEDKPPWTPPGKANSLI